MMPSREELNGWPEDLSAISLEIPDLPETATPVQMARAYATVTLRLAAILPKVVRGLEFLYGAMMGIKGQLAQAMALAARIDALERARVTTPDSLPPARGESPSYIDTRERGEQLISSQFKQLAKRTPGPKVESTPEQLTAVVSPVLDKLLQEREEAMRIRADRERLAAIDAANAKAAREAELLKAEVDLAKRKFKRQITYGAIAAFIVSIAAAAGTATWVRAGAITEGRELQKKEMGK